MSEYSFLHYHNWGLQTKRKCSGKRREKLFLMGTFFSFWKWLLKNLEVNNEVETNLSGEQKNFFLYYNCYLVKKQVLSYLFLRFVQSRIKRTLSSPLLNVFAWRNCWQSLSFLSASTSGTNKVAALHIDSYSFQWRALDNTCYLNRFSNSWKFPEKSCRL